jgi:UDP:flavonoid glycosyltransferase YjiC (YdhE family)
MDQLLNMQMIERIGAGITIRAGIASVDAIRNAAEDVLEDSSYANSARQVAELLAKYDSAQRFREFVAEILSA